MITIYWMVETYKFNFIMVRVETIRHFKNY